MCVYVFFYYYYYFKFNFILVNEFSVMCELSPHRTHVSSLCAPEQLGFSASWDKKATY